MGELDGLRDVLNDAGHGGTEERSQEALILCDSVTPWLVGYVVAASHESIGLLCNLF